ncbi:uncharacterized protein LOC119828224 [Zerene cesonia]|uniref:uncharacterized protein LOC119828224 n=1 Tax=Zerene cesonia TaxID=33412 RepID=UPI0018E52A28|nr:uncharacterized protein LOC119828224 [Zerene cesonia]
MCAKKYDLPKQEILPVRKLKRTRLLLPFRLFMKKQNNNRFKKYTEISIFDKHRICHSNLQEYLATDKVPNEVKTITDLDEHFFEYVNGRPTFLHVPIFKTFKLMLNDFMRLRQEIGYKKDCVFNVDVNKIQENEIYDLAVRDVIQQAYHFDSFISEDYHNSMTLLAKWELLEQKVERQESELQSLANEMFSIKSRIIGLDYKYSQQQKFGRFLYYLSPPTWRLHNRDFARSVEIEAKGFDFGDSNDEDTFTIIFEKLRKVCYEKPVKPVLYFKHPEDIIKVFNAMEYQQLHYFTHVTHLKPYIKNLRENIKTLKDINTQDSASVLSSISHFKNLLIFCEDRCTQLKEKFYKILFGIFYDSVGKLDVLKLKLHLEFCFEKIILDKPLNMDIVSIARNLENFYMEYSYHLDCIKSGNLRRAIKKCQEMENQKIVKANRAAKELRLFDRLEKQLLRAHGLYSKSLNNGVNYQKLHHAKKPDKFKVPSNTKKRQSLTEDELEYLALFTDWTENEDPSFYLQRLSLKDNDDKPF